MIFVVTVLPGTAFTSSRAVLRVFELRRVAPVSGHGPRVVKGSSAAAVMTVASAPGVRMQLWRVRGRRPAARSHRHGQRGDFLGRLRLDRPAAAFPVVIEVHPAAIAAGRRRVNADGPAAFAGRIGSGRLFFES